jgi:hypothetical protein
LYWDCEIQGEEEEEEEGEKVGTPIRLMAKLIGLRRIRANVNVPFKLEFAKILGEI